jgi:hypothetical protein
VAIAIAIIIAIAATAMYISSALVCPEIIGLFLSSSKGKFEMSQVHFIVVKVFRLRH